MLMPKLLMAKAQRGWPLFQRLLADLLKFLQPHLSHAELSEPIRLLYKGTLRVLLVLLHDFPEFLCDYHFSFCDVIPNTCVQLRNLVLSAFPRQMRLPDPFTPNLKVDLLPEISQSPRILSKYATTLGVNNLKQDIDVYLKNRPNPSFLNEVLPKLKVEGSGGRKFSAPMINALVLHVGVQAIGQLQAKASQVTSPSAPMDIFQWLANSLDHEGRYLFLNAIANQLRYPNNHTHYFSCVLLYLFMDAQHDVLKEQITRVLLERLIVNRPHPWGLLITFIELIKNPRYNFWNHQFTRCAPEIERLFESVARSCMGPSNMHTAGANETESG
jgi:CCR4-NOT transcription complex subunit 1